MKKKTMSSKYFKIKFGYGNDEFISIDETELKKAIEIHLTGKNGVFKEGSISGKNVIAIVPDWNKAMGWKRDYKLTGEDYTEIGNKREDEYRDLIQIETTNVQRQLQGLPPLEAPKETTRIYTQGLKQIGDMLPKDI